VSVRHRTYAALSICVRYRTDKDVAEPGLSRRWAPAFDLPLVHESHFLRLLSY